MSATNGDSGDTTSVSAQVDPEFLDEFDLALKKAQIEGEVPMNISRSEAIRRLMQAAVEDPSLLMEVDEE